MSTSVKNLGPFLDQALVLNMLWDHRIIHLVRFCDYQLRRIKSILYIL